LRRDDIDERLRIGQGASQRFDKPAGVLDLLAMGIAGQEPLGRPGAPAWPGLNFPSLSGRPPRPAPRRAPNARLEGRSTALCVLPDGRLASGSHDGTMHDPAFGCGT
jgi:hypothetical protein